MARLLHLRALSLARGKALSFLLVLAVWQLAGCVVPPPEVREEDNLPPWIDWNLTVPNIDEPTFDRTTEDRLEFRLDDSVQDPEGDYVDVLWFWVGPDGLPTPVYGSDTMDLRVCDNRKLANATPGQYVAVKVVVSDAEIEWTGDLDSALPVEVPEGFEVARRIWYVKLLGECP